MLPLDFLRLVKRQFSRRSVGPATRRRTRLRYITTIRRQNGLQRHDAPEMPPLTTVALRLPGDSGDHPRRDAANVGDREHSRKQIRWCST